jgi:hypothetical protein
MHRCFYALVAAALAAAPGFAQTSGTAVEIDRSAGPPLSAEKQLEVKTSIARYSRGLKPGQDLPKVGEKLAIGSIVPPSVELITLPQDSVTEVPATTSYRFVLMQQGIAVVDPESRKVVQVID